MSTTLNGYPKGRLSKLVAFCCYTFLACYFTPEQKEIVDKVNLLMYEAGYKALKSINGVLPPEHEFRPIFMPPLSCCITESTRNWIIISAIILQISHRNRLNASSMMSSVASTPTTKKLSRNYGSVHRDGKKDSIRLAFALDAMILFKKNDERFLPEEVMTRDAAGKLPLQLARELLTPYDFEATWCKLNAPQVHICSLMTKTMSKFASDAVFERLGFDQK